ncbi:MAG: hypothetical protein KF795_22940 [Labilithrix sp.]|nr:hypothetical protein [Labilithrix sp.]
MSNAYRSAYHHIVGVRLAETKLARETVVPLLPRLRAIRSARIARALAGGVGIAGAVCLTASALLTSDGTPTHVLLGAGAASVATYLLARVVLGVAGSFRQARGWTLPRLTGELDADLARIDASNPLHPLARHLGALEAWSTTLPLAAISLLLPLTLHYAFISVTGAETAESFARWIRISLVIVGHAHLALMALAIAFGRKLSRLGGEGLATLSIHREWARAWGIVILVSAMPGLFLLAVPPILTAITGIAFIPFMFALTRRRLMNERATLELAEEATTARVAGDLRVAPSSLEEADWLELAAVDGPHTAERARLPHA